MQLIILIIPYHFIGGAERVHLEIIKSLPKKPIVLFDTSDGNIISTEFKEHAYCFPIISARARTLAKKLIIFISRIVRIKIFGCNSPFFYEILPFLSKKTLRIDLTHAFSYPEFGIENIAINYVKYIDYRIIINQKTLNDYKKLYKKSGINNNYLSAFKIIPNGIELYEFDTDIICKRSNNFKIGYVGRCAEEKRPEVFLQISKLLESNLISSIAIGDDFSKLKDQYNHVDFIEGLNSPKIVRKYFSDISLLIVTSYREGFPLVIMEAMELGIPVLSTDVGSIAEHVKDGYNGYIINEESGCLMENFASKVLVLQANKTLYKQLSLNARAYAVKNFNKEHFKLAYNNIFNQ